MASVGSEASKLLASLGAGLSLSRDLTDEAENGKVLEIATAIVKSGLPLQDFKDACYGDKDGKGAGPTVLVSAVGSAESKIQLKTCGPFHMICIYAMYGEQNRIQKKADHKNGQDFVRMKVKQLEWLFADEDKAKTWEIMAVDDGCPNDSKTLARKVIEAEGYGNRVQVIELEDAVKEGLPYFAERGLKTGCKDSRKGGAILYGLYLAGQRKQEPDAPPVLAMYTDSDLSTDMSLCGLLANGILSKGKMSMGARYGMPETFLVKPPESGPAGHPLSHYEQPNMMKIVMRHYVRVRLLPMLKGIYDTQCAFKCFRAADLMSIISDVRSIGADFDMELLLCALTFFTKGGGVGSELCTVMPTLFTEDFAESNFMASSEDPDKPFKTYAGMNQALVQMHKRYVDPASAEAKAAVDLVAFADGITWEEYKRMVEKLEKENGLTLFDHDFSLETLKAACKE